MSLEGVIALLLDAALASPEASTLAAFSVETSALVASAIVVSTSSVRRLELIIVALGVIASAASIALEVASAVHASSASADHLLAISKIATTLASAAALHGVPAAESPTTVASSGASAEATLSVSGASAEASPHHAPSAAAIVEGPVAAIVGLSVRHIIIVVAHRASEASASLLTAASNRLIVAVCHVNRWSLPPSLDAAEGELVTVLALHWHLLRRSHISKRLLRIFGHEGWAHKLPLGHHSRPGFEWVLPK